MSIRREMFELAMSNMQDINGVYRKIREHAETGDFSCHIYLTNGQLIELENQGFRVTEVDFVSGHYLVSWA